MTSLSDLASSGVEINRDHSDEDKNKIFSELFHSKGVSHHHFLFLEIQRQTKEWKKEVSGVLWLLSWWRWILAFYVIGLGSIFSFSLVGPEMEAGATIRKLVVIA